MANVVSCYAAVISLVACAMAVQTWSAHADEPSIMLGFRAISPNRAEAFFLRPSMNAEEGAERAKVEYEIDNSCEYYVRYNEYFLLYTDTGAKVEAWGSEDSEVPPRPRSHQADSSDGRMITAGFIAGRDSQCFYRYATMPSVELRVNKNPEGQDISQTITKKGSLSYHSIGVASTAQTEKTGLGAYLTGSIGIGLANFEGDWSSIVVPASAELGAQYYLPFSEVSLIARLGYYVGGALMVGDSPCYAYGGPSFALYLHF